MCSGNQRTLYKLFEKGVDMNDEQALFAQAQADAVEAGRSGAQSGSGEFHNVHIPAALFTTFKEAAEAAFPDIVWKPNVGAVRGNGTNGNDQPMTPVAWKAKGGYLLTAYDTVDETKMSTAGLTVAELREILAATEGIENPQRVYIE